MLVAGIITLILIFAFLIYFTVETFKMAHQSGDHIEASFILGAVWVLAFTMLLIGIF